MIFLKMFSLLNIVYNRYDHKEYVLISFYVVNKAISS